MTDAREPRMPAPLRDRLEGLWDPGAPPARVEEALRAAARAHLRPSPWRRRRPALAAATAAAAGIALVLWLRRGPGDLLLADVNGDRRVDIVDARDLARHLRDGGELLSRWDVNRDGAIDLADVDATALEAVRIDR